MGRPASLIATIAHQHRGAPLVPEPPHVVLRSLRPLLGLLQLLLGLAELGQVERRDLLGVLDLLLVPEIPSGMLLLYYGKRLQTAPLLKPRGKENT